MDGVYYIPLLKPRVIMTDEVAALYQARVEARKRKDFIEADRLATEMQNLGFDCHNEDNWRRSTFR